MIRQPSLPNMKGTNSESTIVSVTESELPELQLGLVRTACLSTNMPVHLSAVCFAWHHKAALHRLTCQALSKSSTCTVSPGISGSCQSPEHFNQIIVQTATSFNVARKECLHANPFSKHGSGHHTSVPIRQECDQTQTFAVETEATLPQHVCTVYFNIFPKSTLLQIKYFCFTKNIINYGRPLSGFLGS